MLRIATDQEPSTARRKPVVLRLSGQLVAAAQTLVKEKAEQTKREADSKVDALRVQVSQIGDRQKARIEKRIAEVNADYAVRSAKLEQARKLVAEALSVK